ncbi:hypothetical protein BDV96DRAFT_458812, partial [Lophiotrema nucula]
FTNLPDVPQGVFNTSASIEIATTKAAAWDALTNYPAYAEWNPFTRSATVISPNGTNLPEQRPVEGKKLLLRVQIPPLPLPVNSSTPDNPLHTQVSFENITHVQPELGRLAWKYEPEIALEAERWQAVSDVGGGKVLYESREVYSGSLAEVVKASMGEGLQEGFEAQALGLKIYLE